MLSESIERMLNLNRDSEELSNEHDHASNGLGIPSTPILNEDGEPIWKVLVFDDLGRDVISSVLRVSDLRTWGVTMHMYGDMLLGANRILTDLGIYLRTDTQFQMYLYYISSNPHHTTSKPSRMTFRKVSTLPPTSTSSPQYLDPSLKTSQSKQLKLGLRKALHNSTTNT